MFGERWDENEDEVPLPSSEPVRGRVFGSRGRGFLPEEEKEVSQTCKKSGKGRSNSPEKWSDSESGNDFDNQTASGKSKDHSYRNNSGKSSIWSNRNSFGKYNIGESNAFKCSNEAGSEDSRQKRANKTNGSRYSDDENEYEDRPQNRNPRKSNASKYSDDDEKGYGDRGQKWNPKKSNASKYSDDDEKGYGDRSEKWNPRKSNASKYSDDDEKGYGYRGQKWNPKKSNASKYSDDDEKGYGDRGQKWNPRKSNASKYSDDEAERYEDSPEDTSNSDKRDMSVRKREGRDDKEWNKENFWKDNRKGKEQQQEQQRPKERYIPNPDPENEEDLFSQNIASGINFDRYDDIQVTVTGEDIPQKIEHFDEAKICPLVMENINRSSYVKPTPVQKYALPIIMSGRDMMGCAQTGSGKTAAFLIPTIHSMLESGKLPAGSTWTATPQLLIVTPTRELALQIYVEAKKLTYGSKLKTEICYGGTDIRHQLNKVQKGCNILIATCGRLIDFLNRGAVSLSNLRHLIIDEADKMLDRGFFDDIETIFKHETAPSDDKLQVLMFSATFPERVQSLARMYLKNYIFIAVGIIGAACQDVEQKFFLVNKPEKKGRLINLLEQELTRSKTLVFVQHKRIADILAAKLSELGFPSTSMHGDRGQREREEALRDFRAGKAHVLVATAVAARGLDIRGISYVINYDLPQTVDEYVHRIGRTGRVGNRGLAISFYDPDYDSSLVPGISRILVQAHQNIPPFF